MLDQFFISELKKLYGALREDEKSMSQEEIAKNHAQFRNRAEIIMELSRVAKKDGLLALEGSIEQLDGYEDVKLLASYIIDGNDPKMIEQLSIMNYISKQSEVVDSILNIITIYGMLEVQAGKNRSRLAELLNSMMPSDVALDTDKYDEVTNTDNPDEKGSDIDEFCQGVLRVQPGKACYIEVMTVDEIFKTLSDRDVQRLLREITNGDLAKLMVGLSGEARRKICNNMSTRLTLMVIEDVRYMGVTDDNMEDFGYEMAGEGAKVVLNIASQLKEQEDIKY